MQFKREREKQVENVKKHILKYSEDIPELKKEANQIFIRCKADFNSWR